MPAGLYYVGSLTLHLNRCRLVGMAGGALLAPRANGEPAWRTFEVTTRVEVLKPLGARRVWLPAALQPDTPYQQTLANTFTAEGAARVVEQKPDHLGNRRCGVRRRSAARYRAA